MIPIGVTFVFFNCHQALDTLRDELDCIHRDDYELPEELIERYELKANSVYKEASAYQEMLGTSFTILDWSDRELLLEREGLSKEFAERDFLDRIGAFPVNPGFAIDLDKTGVLKPYLDKRGRLSYTYSERMCYQLSKIIKTLRDHPNTRQAFLSIWDPELDIDNLEEKRVPCSIGYLFFRRENKLHLLYIMRSLDIDKCLGYDIYTSSRLLELVAKQLSDEQLSDEQLSDEQLSDEQLSDTTDSEVEDNDRSKVVPGALHFFVGSLHRFKEVK